MCRQEDGYTFMPGDVPNMHLVSSVYIERKKKERKKKLILHILDNLVVSSV